MAYIGSSPTKVVSRQSANIFTYTATANQTAFTGADDNSNTLACSPSDIMVHMNGIKLEESDYTATTTTVTLGSGAAAGDEVTITAFLTFESADHYTKSAADTRYVNASGDTMTGNLGVNVSPTAALDVRRSDADGKIAEFHQNGGYGFELSSSQTVARFRSGYLQAMSITTDAGSGAGERMRISKEGYITTPNQPIFRVRCANNNNVNGTVSGGVTLAGTSFYQSNTLVQSGSHFSVSTGRFTAPVAGYYYLNFSTRVDSLGSGYGYFTIMDNGGSTVTRNLTNVNTTYQTLHCSAVHYMSANDYVYVRFDAQADTSVNLDSDGFFSGFLVG